MAHGVYTDRVLELFEYFGLGCRAVEKYRQLLQASSIVGHIRRSRRNVASDHLEVNVSFRQRQRSKQRTDGVQHVEHHSIAAIEQLRKLPRPSFV